MKSKHSKPYVFVVQSGDLNWKGKSRSMDDALNRAIKSSTGELSLLTRISSTVHPWHYIDTRVVLLRCGLMVKEETPK